jgi:hypothetical protein
MLDSAEQFGFRGRCWAPLAAAALLAGCVSEDPLPELGDCAVVPEGTGWYEYGELGIGTCLASPSDLRVVADPRNDDNHYLLVLNSNTRNNFTQSSLLSIDASSIDETCSVNGLHELTTDVLPFQIFGSRMDRDPASGLTLVTNRHSAGVLGDRTDHVLVMDTADPAELKWSDKAPREYGPSAFVRVPADPWSVRIDPNSGRAWVLGLTNHTLSSLDVAGDEIGFVDLTGELQIDDAVFVDADHSGSAPDIQLDSINVNAVQDELVTIAWDDGIVRLVYPDVDDAGRRSLFQASSGNDGPVLVDAGDELLVPSQLWNEAGFGATTVAFVNETLAGLIAGEDADGLRSIGTIDAADHALDWSASADAVFAPEAGRWDEAGVFDPEWLVDSDGSHHLYFSGGVGLGEGIGHATGAGRSSLVAAGSGEGSEAGLVLSAGDGWDAEAVFGPSLIKRADDGRYHLYYSGHADASAGPDDLPAGLGIGLAIADAPEGPFVRTDSGLAGTSQVLAAGVAGEWDSEGVAASAVFPDDGRLVLWYQGFDGVQWRTGRALSSDGRTWAKDPANPLFDGVTDDFGRPLRAFAWKASPGNYFTVEGSLQGEMTVAAFEGVPMESLASPVQFTVVGGQALGRGAEDSDSRDGVRSAAAAGDAGARTVHVALRGSTTRLQQSQDTGLGLRTTGRVLLEGFGGSLTGLNGEDPELAIGSVDVARDDDTTWLALHTGGLIGVAQGELAKGDAVFRASPAGAALAPGEAGFFDAEAVRHPALLVDHPGDNPWLFYEGLNGERTSIGLAELIDGVWTRIDGEEPGLSLPRGNPGAWDDASVGQPTVLYDADDGKYKLWYVGSDGEVERMGYAESVDGRTWVRTVDAEGIARPVFDGDDAPFAIDGIGNPSVRRSADGFEMLFDGVLDDVPRVGRARSLDGLSWSWVNNPTTAGDFFSIRTRPGDDDASSTIQLGDGGSNLIVVDGVVVTGVGATEMILSPDGRWGVVANKLERYLVVVDLRDDSAGDFVDSNAYGIEAVLSLPQNHGRVGSRDLQFSPDGQTLWATLGPLVIAEASAGTVRFGTEALLTIDFSLIEDQAEARVLFDDVITSWLPTARGIEEDQGYRTEVSVGPGSFVVNRAGTRAYVSNFNANNLYVHDLTSGARGSLRAVVRGIDENPFEVALSPDEKRLYVANSYGIARNLVQHSTIQVIDVDEESPTFGRVLTRLSNVESRAEVCGEAE